MQPQEGLFHSLHSPGAFSGLAILRPNHSRARPEVRKTTTNHPDGRGPRGEEVAVAPSLGAYLMRLQELGAVEGPHGAQQLSPEMMPIVQALHHVLAGGSVEVRVAEQGNPDIFNELNRRVEQVVRESNALNEAVDFYLTIPL